LPASPLSRAGLHGPDYGTRFSRPPAQLARRFFLSGTDALSFRFGFVNSTSIGSSPTFFTPAATPIGFNRTPVPQSPRAPLKSGEVSDPPFASTIKTPATSRHSRSTWPPPPALPTPRPAPHPSKSPHAAPAHGAISPTPSPPASAPRPR